MKNFLSFMLQRLRERSSWLGLISLATALGLMLTDVQAEAVIAAGMSVAGLIATFTRDNDPPTGTATTP